MTPTPKLRFVERKDFTEDLANPRTLRILQQWFEDKSTDMYYPDGNGEWRDVPLEDEA